MIFGRLLPQPVCFLPLFVFEIVPILKLLKALVNHQIFMFFGQNVPIYCSKLVSVRKRNDRMDEAFNRSITHDSM